MSIAYDIYSEQLSELRMGQALYYPEPSQKDGPVQVGDVGYTRQGAFHRLFNITLQPDHPSQRLGVPDGFKPLDIGDISTFNAALEPGPLHSKTVVNVESADIKTSGTVLPFEASFRFSCTSERGAILILESQTTREQSLQARRLSQYLQEHCDAWHAFADSLSLEIGFGDIMLVSECSKVAAWSSAAYSNSLREFGVSFSVSEAFTPAAEKIAPSAGLEGIGSLERRRSQKRVNVWPSQHPKDHTVFMKAYRLGTRQAYYRSLVYLFMKATHRTRWAEGGNGMPPSFTTFSQTPPAASSSVDDHGVSPHEKGFEHDLQQFPAFPDFQPATALLACVMEANDNHVAVVHDDEWCYTFQASDVSQIISEYTEFYLNIPRLSTPAVGTDGLPEARAIGLRTCAKSNLASSHTIVDIQTIGERLTQRAQMEKDGSMFDLQLHQIFASDLTSRFVRASQQPADVVDDADICKGFLADGHGGLVKVLIKEYNSREFSTDQIRQMLRRFEGETHLWSRLNHPNLQAHHFLDIITVLDSSLRLFFRSEASNTFLHIKRGIQVTQIARALRYLHRQNVIHGWLPDNVFVDIKGTVQLSLSLRCPIHKELETDNQPRLLLKQGDLASFSMLAVELITGESPWCSSIREPMCRINPDPLYRIKHGPRRSRLSPDMWSLFEDMCSRDALKRPTADQVMKRLAGMREL
ncbi:hypothetical protein Hypma_004055 [Hypsizygus marmoreus]|uniref:Protein kinase domain-containing protein n=1 Tax=Hypsizygus marmoreus TaxID=39966 RepID=A0A369J380_HYPMA|nr:hypothetical protein Hypma_004055 [Hypsizygus marmoreus]